MRHTKLNHKRIIFFGHRTYFTLTLQKKHFHIFHADLFLEFEDGFLDKIVWISKTENDREKLLLESSSMLARSEHFELVPLKFQFVLFPISFNEANAREIFAVLRFLVPNSKGSRFANNAAFYTRQKCSYPRVNIFALCLYEIFV